jgi:hypothetical protein
MAKNIALALITLFFAVAMPLAVFSPIIFPRLWSPEHSDTSAENLDTNRLISVTLCASMTNIR